MLPWKRSELWLGSSMQEFNAILDILSANHVEYRWKTTGDGVSARYMQPRTPVMSRWGENAAPSVGYKIYVGREQLEYARNLISRENERR